MLKIAVGHSLDPDSQEAAREVIDQCRQELAGAIPQAGLLFAAIDFDYALILQEIDKAFPDLELIGGSTDGEISSVLEFQQDSLTLMLLSADDIEFKAAVGRNISQDPVAIAQTAAAAAAQDMSAPPKLCITLPESLTTNAVSILKGLEQSLAGAAIVGGATADQFQVRVAQTYQFYKTEVLSDAVPMLLFGGNVMFSHAVASGWQPMGQPSQITKVQGNVIYEIDHKPAVDFYHYYLNDFTPDAAYPLAIFPPGENKFLIRGALSYDREVGSITVSGALPEGASVQIADASMNDIVVASGEAFQLALNQYPGKQPQAALFFSCAWRRLILGTRTNEEYQAVRQQLTETVPSCGFYTYGEIAPLEAGGRPFFHNTTFVTLLLGSQ